MDISLNVFSLVRADLGKIAQVGKGSPCAQQNTQKTVLMHKDTENKATKGKTNVGTRSTGERNCYENKVWPVG